MPPVNSSPSSAKPRAKAARKRARKPAAAKATKASTTRRLSKSSRAKAARTRAANQAEATLRQTQTATRDTADVFGDYAERAVLIPVGAALVARDRMVSTVSGKISSYSSTAQPQHQLR